MSENDEQSPQRLRCKKRGNYRRWADSNNARVPESTVRYWRKTGRYPEWFGANNDEHHSTYDRQLDQPAHLDGNNLNRDETVDVSRDQNDIHLSNELNVDHAAQHAINCNGNVHPDSDAFHPGMLDSPESGQDDSLDDSGSESDFYSASGESIYEETSDGSDSEMHSVSLENSPNLIDDHPRDYLDEYRHLIERNDMDQEEVTIEEEPDVKRMKLYKSARINQVHSELLHLAKALRFNNTDADLKASLKLTNRHLPYDLYESMYLFLQRIPQPNVIEYYFCVECEMLLGFGDALEIECEGCDVLYKKKELKKVGQYFLYMSLKEQLINLLESEISQHLRKSCEESDIVTADVYKNMREDGTIGEDDVTITADTDGVTPFNQTKAKLWPLLVTVNELPYRVRKNNVLLIALWYWSMKPLMNLFLKPFVDELIILKKEGFKCKLFGEVEKLIRVHLLLFIADLPAKALVLNMKQFNAMYGCPYCLIRGKSVEVGRGRARVFCECASTLRTNKMYKEHLQQVLRKREIVKGIKGPTQLARVPHLHMFNSIPPEYMHAELLGTVISFLEGWFNSKYHGKPFYLGNKKDEFNRRMTSIRPSHEITRPPVSLGGDWKASQMKNIAIYYSLACLYGLMDEKYYKHWFLFVYGLTLCLRDKVSGHDRRRAKKAFDLFVEQIVELYGEEFMKANVHSLLHVIKFVERYGALWAWSAFPFESFNGVLANRFHGTQHIDEQMFKMANRLAYLRNNAHEFNSEDCDPETTQLFLELTKESNITRIIEHGEHLRVCGRGVPWTLSLAQKEIVEDVVGDSIHDACMNYERFIFKRTVFTTCSYTRAQIRSNHMASLDNGDFIKISNLLGVRTKTTNEEQYVVLGSRMVKSCESLCKCDGFDSNELMSITRDSTELICCRCESLQKKLISIPMTQDQFCLVPIVNKVETD